MELLPVRGRFALLAITIAVSGAALSAPLPAGAGETRAVIELFTSQGCSSCPAADKLLGEYTRDPSVIALSLPIDYWDYLGWKDTLALPGHAKRQRAYSRVRGDREVFTPQAIINGAAYALGSDRTAIENAVTRTRADAVMSLPLQVAVNGERIAIDVPARRDAGNDNDSDNGNDNDKVRGEVWLCPIARQVAVAIGRGENHDRNITYHNVVRGWMKLGDWSGKPASYSVPVSDVTAKDKAVDGVVVLVQSGSAAAPGPIVGAAAAPLR